VMGVKPVEPDRIGVRPVEPVSSGVSPVRPPVSGVSPVWSIRLSSPNVVIIELGVNVGMMLEGVVIGIPASVFVGNVDVARAREFGRAVGAVIVVVATAAVVE